jgi:hypothetical protein
MARSIVRARPPAGGTAAVGALITGPLAALLAYPPLVRPWQLRWGASDEEIKRTMAGDELIAEPTLVSTRAAGIDAAPELAWPWLAQPGQGRGGFCSGDWIENLIGLHTTAPSASSSSTTSSIPATPSRAAQMVRDWRSSSASLGGCWCSATRVEAGAGHANSSPRLPARG